jgi:UDP-N-acetylmuramoylalanine--D-glutamate ligase
MEADLAAAALPIHRVTTVHEAVELAAKLAKKGNSVLFSPGCSFLDQFDGVEKRTGEFKQVVKGLK